MLTIIKITKQQKNLCSDNYTHPVTGYVPLLIYILHVTTWSCTYSHTVYIIRKCMRLHTLLGKYVLSTVSYPYLRT